MSNQPAGWQPDPRGRHQYRYWDGSKWTDHVANNGEPSTDPYEDSPATEAQPAAAAAPEPAAGSTGAGPEPATAGSDPVGSDPAGEPAGSGGLFGGAAASTPPASSSAPPGTGPTSAAAAGETTPPPATSTPAASGDGTSRDTSVSAADTAKAQAQAALHAKSPDLAVLLSVIAPGSGHLYMGVEPAKRNLALALLGATLAAVVVSYFSFPLFLVAFVVWAAAAFFAVKDLTGGIDTVGETSIPQQFVGLLLVAGGALLVLSLLLPWYHVKISGGGLSQSANGNGFEVLELIDIVLVVIGVAAVIAGLAQLGIGVDAAKLPSWLPLAVAIGGAIALVLVYFRMFVDSAPSTDGFGVDVTIGRAPGILLAASAAIILVMANLSRLKALRK